MTALVPPLPRLNPYVGPRPFERGQRLYGRDREVAKLRDLLIAERIVLLYSPSGAGKTSLLRASLIPELEREGFRVLPEIRVGAALPPADGTVQPGNRYLMSTLLSLEKGQSAEHQRDLDELAGMGLGDYLGQPDDEHDGEVLIFDQFEELLVVDITDQDAKSAFLTEVGAVLRDRRRWAVFAIREDFVAGLDPYLRLLPTRLRTTFRLDLLGEAAARLAIQSPAREAGVDFTDAAAQKLTDSLRRVRLRGSGGSFEALGPYVEPVQLQVVCERLWERPRADPLHIAESDIQEAGDVDSALAGYYTHKVAAIAADTGADERAIRTWFDRALITEQGLRSQVLGGPLDGAPEDEQVLWLLEDAHLVRAEARRGARWFELAHDRLIEAVRSSNAEWREATLQLFQRQAALWHSEYRPDSLLLTGDALTEADRWAEEHPGELTAIEREFLTASHHARDELQRAQHQARIIRSVVIVLSLGIIVMAAYTTYATRRASSQALAAGAIAQLEEDPVAALRGALEAAAWPSHPLAQTALGSSLAESHVTAILRGRPTAVSHAEFSPDGQLVITVREDGTAQTWNAMTGERRAVLGGQDMRILTAQFSPDGSQVVTGHLDNAARVWDAQTGREQRVLKGSECGAVSTPQPSQLSCHVDAQWSPDGSQIVTTSLDNTARVWDAQIGREQHVLQGHTRGVLRARWSPDGSQIVTTSSDGTARVWDPATGSQLAELSELNVGSAAAAFSPDGTQVALVGTEQVGETAQRAYLWEWDTNQPPIQLVGIMPEFSPDGRYVLTVDKEAVGRETVRVWEATSGQPVGDEGEIHQDGVTAATFSPDGARIVSGSEDNTVRIWDVASGMTLVELRGHQDAVFDVAFNRNPYDPARPTVVSASKDGTARVWNPHIGQVLSGLNSGLNNASFSADGTLVAGVGADGIARVWRTEMGEPLAELPTDPLSLASAAFSHDGRYLVTGENDGNVRIWEWRTGQEPVTSVSVGGSIGAVAFDPTDRFVVIAGGSDNAARIWEWATTKPPRVLRGHESLVTDAAFSPNGSLVVTASLDQTARVWDTVTGMERYTLDGHRGPVYSADFSPDGRFIVTASGDGTARIWDEAIGYKLLLRLKDHKSPVHDAAFSPDGHYIVTGDQDGIIGLWEISTRQQILALPQLTRDEDDLIWLRETSTSQMLALQQMHEELVKSVQFSPDGRVILTASADGTNRIYECEICTPIEDLRNLANDRLRYVEYYVED